MEGSFPGRSVQLISWFNWKVAFHSLHEISESLNWTFGQIKSVLARYQAALMLQQVTFAKFCNPTKCISMWPERIIFQHGIICRPQRKGQTNQAVNHY